jgi:hypothetical protein
MPDRTHYQFVLEIFDANGTALGSDPFVPDWVPAREWARFEAIRLQKVPPMTATAVDFEPIWEDRARGPYVRGMRGCIRCGDGQTFSVDFPKTYFHQDARSASTRYVSAGRLRDGDVFYFKVMAFAVSAPGSDTSTATIEEIPQPVEILDTPIAQFRANSVAVGPSVDGDAPVFLSSEALNQAKEMCAAAGDVEVGGILLGRLHRDTLDRELVFIEITAQVPAEHTVQQFTKLTFTAQTWAAARAAMRLRDRGEQFCGWIHLHPDFCRVRQCDAAKREKCELAGIFFSSADCALHRTVFCLPQHLGLLISDRNGSLVPAVFGWRRGLIVQRAFHVTYMPSATVRERQFSGGVLAAVGGNENGDR